MIQPALSKRQAGIAPQEIWVDPLRPRTPPEKPGGGGGMQVREKNKQERTTRGTVENEQKKEVVSQQPWKRRGGCVHARPDRLPQTQVCFAGDGQLL